MSEGTAQEQMIAAAERLAVERGLGAMSLRAVQEASGQRNKSAAQYHFGSRAGLIEAVVAARMGPVNEQRQAMLAALDASPGAASTRDLTAALVTPLAQHTIARPGSRWARFLVQGMSDPALSGLVRRNLEGASYRAVRARLLAAIDHVPERLRARRVDHAVGLLVLSLAATEAAQEAAAGPSDPADPSVPVPDLVADLVDVCTAVLTAPSTVPSASAPVQP